MNLSPILVSNPEHSKQEQDFMETVTNINEALEIAKTDKNVGIAIAPLSTGINFCLFSAEIKEGKKVGCHYHSHGEEVYSILSGSGIIYTALVDEEEQIGEIKSRQVYAGDNFTINAGTAHQLKAVSDLVLMFVCPPEHVSSDRTMLPCLTP